MTVDLKACLNAAVGHLRAGQLADADAKCVAVLNAWPEQPDAWELRGLVASQAGDYAAAAQHLGRALQYARSRSPATLSNLAEALLRLNRLEEVLSVLREAIDLAPDYAIAHGKLAVAFSRLGRVDDALAAVRAGLEHAPSNAELHGILAGLLITLGKPEEAIPHLYAALEGAPRIETHWTHLYRLLLIGSLPADRAGALLLQALSHPRIRPAMIAPSVALSLEKGPRIAAIIDRAEQSEEPDAPGVAQLLEALGKEELLLALMALTPVPNPSIERLLTFVRRALLRTSAIESREVADDELPFCVALANQAFLTGYAWQVPDDELELVERYVSDLDANEPDTTRMLLVACYRPLHKLDCAALLSSMQWPEALQPLIRMQVEEPLLEDELQADIPSLTEIADPVSVSVQTQYEEDPYPRWVRAEQIGRVASLPAFVASLGGTVPAEDSTRTAPEVLIAGCGTGQQIAIAASRYVNAKIVALDISRTSLAYAARKLRELGIENVRLVQGDILELGILRHQFDVIESSGVLHHLADPVEGWRVLSELLRPYGIMNVGLYSEIARRSLMPAHEHIEEHGYRPNPSDIRSFRRDMLALPADHPLASLRGSIDFYNLSACRDLLFHANEHRFTLPQIRAILEKLNLDFLQFELMDTSGYRRQFPDDPRMASLQNWDVYERENPSTFSGMYQFWVQKRARD